MPIDQDGRVIEAAYKRMERLSKNVCKGCNLLQKDLGVRKDIIHVYFLRFFQIRAKDDIHLAILVIELRKWYKRELSLKRRKIEK